MNELIRPRLSRRALLTLGGLSLLTGCSSPAAARTAGGRPSAGAGSASPSAAASTGASAGPSPSPVPGTGTGLGTTVASPSPGASGSGDGEPVFYVHQGPHAIALTIDDGPDPRYTPQVLALLERYDITATFCQLGQQVSRFPTLVGEVSARGHLLANHTWTHADLTRATAPAIRDELTRTSEALEEVTGVEPTFFRAPYGAWSRQVLDECRRQNLTPLAWSVDPRDWSRPGAGHITDTILRTTRPGSIILEHDGGGDRSQTVAALRIVLPRLLDEGYTFVTP
ncbi:polysaccharide deacetylase family protein [Streptacidiphilus jiangxiensis]|uniref:polysaccharide deacetylase family protein n=1 Tax=Streptacidiphilus jiangxiensis TaxID=235985 RepID=UPI000693DA82|nr:polysaccharide deacetylase family protein [Streptacidiphilus jiangxiensis]